MKTNQQMSPMEQTVLKLLEENAAGIRREKLQRLIYGKISSNGDRYIRAAISRLRTRGFVIASASDTAGYRLTNDRHAVTHYVNETRKRARELMKTASRVEKSHGLKKQMRMPRVAA